MSGYWKPEYNKKRLEMRREARLKRHKDILGKFKKIKDPILLGYVAGLVDGEGCILINKYNKAYTLQLRVGMSVISAVERMHKIFGGSLGTNKSKNHTLMYVWVLSSIEAEGLLKLILPYLLVKREEAKVAIAFREHIISTRNKNKCIPIKALAIREEYRLKLQELKR